jgi:hypothetical protein
VQAGDKAAAAYANQDALDFYARALAICEKLGDAALPTVLAVAQKRGDIHLLRQHAPGAIGDYDRMAAAARRRGTGIGKAWPWPTAAGPRRTITSSRQPKRRCGRPWPWALRGTTTCAWPPARRWHAG